MADDWYENKVKGKVWQSVTEVVCCWSKTWQTIEKSHEKVCHTSIHKSSRINESIKIHLRSAILSRRSTKNKRFISKSLMIGRVSRRIFFYFQWSDFVSPCQSIDDHQEESKKLESTHDCSCQACALKACWFHWCHCRWTRCLSPKGFHGVPEPSSGIISRARKADCGACCGSNWALCWLKTMKF